MKNLTLSMASIIAMSAVAMAGGDIEPIVEPKVEVPVVQKVEPATYSSAGFYVGIAYSYGIEAQRTGITPNNVIGADDATWELAGMLMAGYQINDNFAVEGRFTSSLDDVKYDGNSIGDYDLTNAAIYAKVMYPIENVVTAYALLGYGETTVEDQNINAEYKSDGLQWGVGAAYKVNENVSVFADYTKLALEDEYELNSVDATRPELDVSTVNLGVAYKF